MNKWLFFSEHVSLSLFSWRICLDICTAVAPGSFSRRFVETEARLREY